MATVAVDDAEVFKAAGVSDEEATLITHGNAERVFNWKIASADLLTSSTPA